MMLYWLTVLQMVFVGGGAVALAIIDLALKPESGRFPCGHPVARVIIKCYAASLFFRAAILFSSARVGLAHPGVSYDSAVAAFWLWATHMALMVLMMRARMPNGVWARLQRRLQFAKAAAANPLNRPGDPLSSPEAAIMAAEGAPPESILAAEGFYVFAPRKDPRAGGER